MGFKEHKYLNLSATAKHILDFWKEKSIFEKSIETRKGQPPFVFFEGPPSANGMPGIHHVMARSIQDIFCRYKTLKRFQTIEYENVPFFASYVCFEATPFKVGNEWWGSDRMTDAKVNRKQSSAAQ